MCRPYCCNQRCISYQLQKLPPAPAPPEEAPPLDVPLEELPELLWKTIQ